MAATTPNNTNDRFALQEGEEDFDVILSDPSRRRSAAGSQYGHNTEAAIAKADAPEPRQTSNQYGTFTNHAASEKQVAFAKRLLAERPSYRLATPVETLDKRQMSKLIDDLLKTGPEAAATPANLASEKQVAFLESLWVQRYPANVERPDFAAMSKADASKNIEALKALPKLAHTATVATDGYEATKGDVHVIDGEYYRVHIGQSSNRPYAVKAIVLKAATWNDDGSLAKAGSVDWEYDGSYMRKLSKATLATAAEAKAFGQLAGRCCFCSTPIDTPESTTAGYGPKCASNRGLPWGQNVTTATTKKEN